MGLTPVINDGSGRIKNESWQWQRSETSDGPFTDIPAEEGGTVRHYVPSESDLEKWLRLVVAYDDGFGTGRSASATSHQPVLSQPVVSNAGQIGIVDFSLTGTESASGLAQAFSTGPDLSGYSLAGLRFGLKIDTSVDALSWTIHADDGNKPASEPLFPPFDHSLKCSGQRRGHV